MESAAFLRCLGYGNRMRMVVKRCEEVVVPKLIKGW